jgi:hypothetical protein
MPKELCYFLAAAKACKYSNGNFSVSCALLESTLLHILLYVQSYVSYRLPRTLLVIVRYIVYDTSRLC